MKKINESIIFIFILIISILLINEFYYNNVIEKKVLFRHEMDFQDYLLGNNSIRYLFLGDSHTANGINPRYINESYNLAFVSTTYIEDYYILEKTIHIDKVKLDYIFLEIDTHSFSSYMIDQSFPLKYDTWYYSKFVPVDEMSNLTGKSQVETIIFSTFPFIGNGVDLLSDKSNPSKLYLGYRFNRGNFSKVNMSKSASKRIDRQFLNKKRIDETLMEYYLKILKTAEDNNISIILIKYPVSKSYDEELTERNITRIDYYNEILNFTNNTISNYIVLDYSVLFSDCNECFSNSDHLNSLGAEKLSKQVNNDIAVLHEVPINSSFASNTQKGKGNDFVHVQS